MRLGFDEDVIPSPMWKSGVESRKGSHTRTRGEGAPGHSFTHEAVRQHGRVKLLGQKRRGNKVWLESSAAMKGNSIICWNLGSGSATIPIKKAIWGYQAQRR